MDFSWLSFDCIFAMYELELGLSTSSNCFVGDSNLSTLVFPPENKSWESFLFGEVTKLSYFTGENSVFKCVVLKLSFLEASLNTEEDLLLVNFFC